MRLEQLHDFQDMFLSNSMHVVVEIPISSVLPPSVVNLVTVRISLVFWSHHLQNNSIG